MPHSALAKILQWTKVALGLVREDGRQEMRDALLVLFFDRGLRALWYVTAPSRCRTVNGVAPFRRQSLVFEGICAGNRRVCVFESTADVNRVGDGLDKVCLVRTFCFDLPDEVLFLLRRIALRLVRVKIFSALVAKL